MSEHFLDQDVPATPSSAAQEPDVEDEEEEEIDELVSEPDLEPPSRQSRSPSPIQRETGTSLLPVSKMEEILCNNAHPNILALSKEALFLVSTATEEFIKKMTRSGLMKASAEQRKTVCYSDMSYVTQQYQEFMFLQELIPPPMTLAEALELRQEKEREQALHDPALTIRENIIPASSPPPSAVVRQLPPVPPAPPASAPRPQRTRTKATKPKPQPVADPNGAAPYPDRSGVPQHMQHQMQMQVNGDFALTGGVSMQVDMTDSSTMSRSSSRSAKSKRKEPKAPAPAKRRKTALETPTTATPASSVGTSPPLSRSRSASTSASVPPSGYPGNSQPSAYHPPPSLDYIADRSLSNSSATSRKKKDTNPAPVPSHVLDPALTNGNAYPQESASSHRASSPPAPIQREYNHSNQSSSSSQWPTGNPYPSSQPLGMNGGTVGRTIYSTNSRSTSAHH